MLRAGARFFFKILRMLRAIFIQIFRMLRTGARFLRDFEDGPRGGRDFSQNFEDASHRIAISFEISRMFRAGAQFVFEI